MLSADFGFVAGIGGGGIDDALNVATDAAGNSYVTGYFEGTVDFDPGTGITNLSSAGGRDAFVSKYDSSGNLAWAKRFGGTGSDRGFGLALDGIGNVHVSGEFSSTADFDPGAGTFNLMSAGQSNAFVVKLDNSGNFVWGARLGGSGSDFSQSLTVDGSGNVYTLGHFDDFADADFDPGAGFFNPVINGGGGANDVFISKLDSGGNFVWALGFGGSGDDHGTTITTDTAGNFYVGGDFRSSIVDFDPGPGVANRTSAGSYDAYVQKFDSSGNLVWVATMGSSSIDGVSDVAIDSAGNVIAVGAFRGTMDFDPGQGTANISIVGGSNGDAFVLKLDNTGNFVWAKTVGSPGFEHARSVAVDSSDNIWITGSFTDTADFDPGVGVFNLTNAGPAPTVDMFLWQLDANGDFLDALSIGGNGFDVGIAIALDNTNVLIAGSYRETVDFDPGPGTENRTIVGGLQDGYLLKLTQNQPPLADAGGNQTTNGGQPITLDGSGSSDDGSIVSYSWDFGDGGSYSESAGSAGDGAFDGMTTHTYADDGTFTVTLTVTDDEGTSSSSTATIIVLNQDPAVSLGPDETIDEGTTFVRGGSFSDPETDTWTATVDYGDGSGVQPLPLNPDKTFDLDHVYDDNGTYTASVTVTDDDGGVGTDQVIVTVNNVAPDFVVAEEPYEFDVAENSPATTVVGQVNATDVGILDALTYSITSITSNAVSGSVSDPDGDTNAPLVIDASTGEITVNDPDDLDFENVTQYTLIVEVTDDDDGTDTTTVTINVLNEANVTGFVFADVDNDGVFDVEDAPLANVEITLIEAGVDEVFGTADDETFSTTTDNDGFYGFEDVAAGKVRIIESGAPADLADGIDTPNGVTDLDTVNDQFTIDLARTDVNGMNFAELADGGGLSGGDTATIGFWHNKNGQALIARLDEEGALTAWLLNNFGNIFDAADFVEHGGSVGKFYRDEFFKKKLKGTPKVDAQFMAVAFATFATSLNLSNGGAVDFGFNVTDGGIGTTVVNVGDSGAAFGVANGTDMTIMALLLATNSLTATGADLIYDDGDDILTDSEKALRVLANVIYTAINEEGSI